MIRPLSLARVRYFSKLKLKKQRRQEGLFIVSGRRAVEEILASPLSVELLILENGADGGRYAAHDIPLFSTGADELKRITDVQTPQEVAAVVRLPEPGPPGDAPNMLYLDGIGDPGNLGAIIRTAAWFGWPWLLLSPGSTDPYQPKTVRATAGMIGYVNIVNDFPAEELRFLKEKGYTLWGTNVSGGRDIKSVPAGGRNLILMGSEAHGLSPEAGALTGEQLYIKRTGRGESLNMAMAAGIIMHHFSNATKP